MNRHTKPAFPAPHSAIASSAFTLVLLLVALSAAAATDDRLIGRWTEDEGFQINVLTFRSDGRYLLDTRSTDPAFDFEFLEQGTWAAAGGTLTLSSDDYIGEPAVKRQIFGIEGTTLSLTHPELEFTRFYQYEPGSTADVLTRERVERDLIGTWWRPIPNAGSDEYTFRPGGYYVLRRLPEDEQLPPEIIRGRYTLEGSRLTLQPYSGVEQPRELDFYGELLTLIRREPLSGETTGLERVPGSAADVRARAAVAEAFLARAGWQVGVWEVREPFLNVDVTFRPDGHFIAVHATEFLQGVVRGRYELESRSIRLSAFPGQDPYARSNGEFGKGERTRVLDYFDGELQFINLESLSQSVVTARLRPGSEAAIVAKTRAAQAERARPDWLIGSWEVRDPLGWMQFTFRPDQRYLAESGVNGVPGQVERGRWVAGPEKVTLAPYEGLGPARGFELDLYDGDLFLAGDRARLVIARKLPGSDVEVIEKTRNPSALKGERGPVLGRWLANLPGQFAELVFRPDGQFRVDRCGGGTTSRDYGLYSVDLAARTLVMDSRVAPVRTLGLDYYGDTLTLHGAPAGPTTWVVQLGSVDAAIGASLAADAAREQIDSQWLTRVPTGPAVPGSGPVPGAGLPADPRPDRVFPGAATLSHYHLYRRFIPGLVVFDESGTIRSVNVLNSREWHFFPDGRVLVRFRNHFAGAVFPKTIEDVSDSWGAYRLRPNPGLTDILHLYADDVVEQEMDSGDRMELTLEEGRRLLFWGKDSQTLSEWAAEEKPVPCQLPDGAEPRLLNTGLTLASDIPPDATEDAQPMLLGLVISGTGDLTLRGTTALAGTLVVDRATHLTPPIQWEALQTNQVSAGTFTLAVPRGAHAAACFRLRRQ